MPKCRSMTQAIVSGHNALTKGASAIRFAASILLTWLSRQQEGEGKMSNAQAIFIGMSIFWGLVWHALIRNREKRVQS